MSQMSGSCLAWNVGGMILLLGAGRGQCGAAVNPPVLFFSLKRQENKQSGTTRARETLFSTGVVA